MLHLWWSLLLWRWTRRGLRTEVLLRLLRWCFYRIIVDALRLRRSASLDGRGSRCGRGCYSRHHLAGIIVHYLSRTCVDGKVSVAVHTSHLAMIFDWRDFCILGRGAAIARVFVWLTWPLWCLGRGHIARWLGLWLGGEETAEAATFLV